jgi:hypothetical protein
MAEVLPKYAPSPEVVAALQDAYDRDDRDAAKTAIELTMRDIIKQLLERCASQAIYAHYAETLARRFA